MSSITPQINKQQWDFSEEIRIILNVSIAQLAISVHESDAAVEELITAFKTLVFDISTILEDFEKKITNENQENIQEQVKVLSDDICTRVNSSIIAFQFYDRLVQQLDHISTNLSNADTIISEEEQYLQETTWRTLKDNIRVNYTMEAERTMFDAIIKGKTINEAVQLYLNADKSEHMGNVELF